MGVTINKQSTTTEPSWKYVPSKLMHENHMKSIAIWHYVLKCAECMPYNRLMDGQTDRWRGFWASHVTGQFSQLCLLARDLQASTLQKTSDRFMTKLLHSLIRQRKYIESAIGDNASNMVKVFDFNHPWFAEGKIHWQWNWWWIKWEKHCHH